VQTGDASTGQGFYHCQVSDDSASNVLSAGFNLVVKPINSAHLSVVIKFFGTNTAPFATNNFIAKKNFFAADGLPVTISGVAGDDGHIEQVWLIQSNFNGVSSALQSALTPTKALNGLDKPQSVLWTNTVNLVDGTNWFIPHVQDEAAFSKTGTPNFVYLLDRTSLSFTTNGPGTATADYAGALGDPRFKANGALITNVYVNIGYTARATPRLTGITHGFDGWYTNNVLMNPNKVMHFTIPDTTGLNLEARFH